MEGSVEFVYMTHEGIETPAKVPVSAVPHWEGSGWVQVPAPPRPRPAVKSAVLDAPPAPAETPTEPAVDTPVTKSKTAKAAPAGRKED
jgi:hypothetical protein